MKSAIAFVVALQLCAGVLAAAQPFSTDGAFIESAPKAPAKKLSKAKKKPAASSKASATKSGVSSEPSKSETAETRSASVAMAWMDIILEAATRDAKRHGPRPTVASRALALSVTAMYDAWAAYDAQAIGTRYRDRLRRPAAQRTRAHRETAIAHAVHRALVYLYPEERTWLDEQMTQRGLDPQDQSMDVGSAAGAGNLAAEAVIQYRRRDGANQHGDESGGPLGNAYADYTFYAPYSRSDKASEPDRWQPAPASIGPSSEPLPPNARNEFLTPHWYRVRTFGLARGDQFRPGAPPAVGSAEKLQHVDECLKFLAELSPQQKATIEYFSEGPRSLGQSGRWLRFAQFVSRRDGHDLDRDVKLFFAVGNVAMDAYIAAWDAKRRYETARPWSLVRHYYKGKTVRGWGGPGKGTVPLLAEHWRPYAEQGQLAPAWPGCASEVAAVGVACAKVLEQFTKSDAFNLIEMRTAGTVFEPGCPAEQVQAVDGRPAKDVNCAVEIAFETFSAAAETASIATVQAGFNLRSDHQSGSNLGRDIANYVWPICQGYFTGTLPAKP